MAINVDPSAFGPVKAVAAEHVVAHWRSEQGGSPTLYGGRRKGHDVTDGEQLIDAKLLVPASASEAKREGCTRKLRRDLWKAFDPVLTTHVMLVDFPAEWTGQSDTSFSQTTITIQHDDVRLYLVEVDEINEILASRRAEAEAARWAFIFLDDDWLEERLVHPLPAAEAEDQP